MYKSFKKQISTDTLTKFLAKMYQIAELRKIHWPLWLITVYNYFTISTQLLMQFILWNRTGQLLYCSTFHQNLKTNDAFASNFPQIPSRWSATRIKSGKQWMLASFFTLLLNGVFLATSKNFQRSSKICAISDVVMATLFHWNADFLPINPRWISDGRRMERYRVNEEQWRNFQWNWLQIVRLSGDFSADFDGETAKLSIAQVYPEDEGEYSCIAFNQLGKAVTSACLIVDCE